MRRAILSAVALFGIATLSGCVTEPTAERETGISTKDFLPWSTFMAPATYGQLMSVAARQQGSGTVIYQSGGQVFDGTSHRIGVSGGTMTANGLSIATSSSPAYGSGYYVTMATPTFGAVTTWGLAGNNSTGIASWIDSMYVPTLVAMSAPAHGSTQSRSTGFSIQWNADANNDSVVVAVQYMADASRESDTTLPAAEATWYSITADDGSFRLPSGALSGMPVGGLLRVVVARGNGRVMGTSTQQFQAYAYAYAHAIVKVAQ